MDVVSDKTGYPTDMLELGMDMESDLGIDSIKRVEILGSVQEIISDLPELNPEDLAELRTLGEIVDYMQSKVTAAPVSQTSALVNATPSIDLGHIQNVMMDVVSDKTGYPTDMLELGMDMEADLGIDSIKRVEILGAVQEIITDLPDLNPEDLAELRTLGEIVSYMQSKVSAPVAANVSNEFSTEVSETPAASSTDLAKIEQVMMEVVSDKTGYPVAMLELGMDMEADLGIDSIKRVEILGAVQEIITDLPELNPEDLAELRTLGEIVGYMQQQGGATSSGTSISGTSTSDSATASNNDIAQSDVVEFIPAPSATVAIARLGQMTKITSTKQSGHALIVDDGTGSAVALAAKLHKVGWQVTALKPEWITASSTKAFAKSIKVITIAQVSEEGVAAVFENQPAFDALIYMQPSSNINNIQYPQASKQGLMLAFLLAKYSNLAKHAVSASVRTSFIAVTRQGGNIGFVCEQLGNQDIGSDLIQGGLNGLVKTLHHEWNVDDKGVFCRSIDFSNTLSSEKVASLVIDEMLDADTDLVEVGYDVDGRMTLVGVATDSYQLSGGNSINQQSVFLVSGGAKGVTAHCVIEIAKQFQSKFILLGRSVFNADEPSWAHGINDEADLKKAGMQALIAAGDKPTPMKVMASIKPILANREISNTLSAIKAAGGEALYVSSDVTNAQSVKDSVEQPIKQLGKISGLIHGAGVLADKFIEQKALTDFEAVYSTKIDGLLSMLAVVDQDALQHLVLFSSAAGFYGNPGQSDYSIANDILNKTAYRFKALHPQTQVLSFNWGPWDGGMVTPELKRMFKQRGVYIIGLDAGAKLLVSELASASNRCPQILVGNDLSKDNADDTTVQNVTNSKTVQDTQESSSVKKSLVSRLSTAPAQPLQHAVISKSLLATNNTFLNDHVINNNRVLPTVCAIAWMSDAATTSYGDYQYVGFSDYQLFKGVIFDGSEASDYYIELTPMADSTNDTQGSAETIHVKAVIYSHNDDAKPVYHYGAQLILQKNALINKVFSGSKLPTLRLRATPDSSLYHDGTLFHGESLQGINHVVSCNEQGLLLACQVPDIANAKQGDFSIEQSNIFANDLVYQAMLVWARQQYGLGSLPTACKQWTVYREVKAGEAFFLQLSVTQHDLNERRGSKVVCDIELIDKNQQLLAQISGAEVRASKALNKMFVKA